LLYNVYCSFNEINGDGDGDGQLLCGFNVPIKGLMAHRCYSLLLLLLLFLNPRKTRVGKKIEKVKKNGEANVPSGRPTQKYCATKQN